MQPFFDQKQKKISPPDHVVISETLPLPLVVIHGHFMNPPSPSSDHVVYGCPLSSCKIIQMLGQIGKKESNQKLTFLRDFNINQKFVRPTLRLQIEKC